jgi:hypothetical protein
MTETTTNTLIKHVAFDIVTAITIWGFLSRYDNINIYFNNKIYPVYTNLIGFSISTYILGKYI